MNANVKVGNLTDAQLRQQLTQLSASQYSNYATTNVAAQPQRIATPTAAASTTRRSHSAVPPPAATSVTGTTAVTYAPSQTVRRPAGPVLATTPQALQTTYASRMRTGATLLMQPILASSSSNTTTAQTTTRTRRGGVISYAEPGSGDEMPDAGEIDSDGDDKDFMASGGLRTSVRNMRGAAGSSGTPRAAPAGPPPPKSGELEQSYLGGIPRSRFISAKPATATRHDPLYVYNHCNCRILVLIHIRAI